MSALPQPELSLMKVLLLHSRPAARRIRCQRPAIATTSQCVHLLPALMLLAACCNGVLAQDIHFSQFYLNPLTVNPAAAGSEHDLRGSLNYRSQWQSVDAPFVTYSGAFDVRLGDSPRSPGHWGIGVLAFGDQAGGGLVRSTSAGINAGYHVRVSDYSTLGAAALVGFAQRSLDPSAFRTGSQYNGQAYDPSRPNGESSLANSFAYLDAGFGVQWTYSNTSKRSLVTGNNDFKAEAGIAVFNLHRPTYSFADADESLYARLVIHGGALITVPNSNLGFTPRLLAQFQGPSREIVAGGALRYKLRDESKVTGFYKGTALSLGALVRAKDAVVVTSQIEFGHYTLGVSYDLNTSDLRTASDGRGGVEFVLRYVTPNPFNQSSARFR